jgi:hypothetical protein
MSKADGKNRLVVEFMLDSNGKRVSHELDYDDGVTWDRILKDFISALHGYGYVGIDERVFVLEPSCTDADSLVLMRDIEPYLEENYE